jgi:hypothetical protein
MEKQGNEDGMIKQSVIVKEESLIRYYGTELDSKEIMPFLV